MIGIGALVAIGLGVLVVGFLAFGPAYAMIRRRRDRTVLRMYGAAARGDAARLEAMVARRSVDLRDARGNTALHWAYFSGQQDAIQRLRAFGADENLRNNEGLTPAQMARVADTQQAVRLAASLVFPDGSWSDAGRARSVYDRLVGESPRIFAPAIVRAVLACDPKRETHRRQQILMVAIKVGKPGSERRLAEVLDGFGDKAMAEDFLNCGSDRLADAAYAWARRHGYTITQKIGGGSARWGQF